MANPYIAIAAAIIAIGTAVYIWTTRTKDNTEALDANIKKNQEARTALQKIIDFRLASIANVDAREKAQLVEKQRRERADLDKEFHDKAQYNELKLAQEQMFQTQLNDLAEKQAKKKETKKKTTTDDSLPSWYKGGLAPIEGIATKSGIAIKSLTDSMGELKQIGSDSFLTLTTHVSRFQMYMEDLIANVGPALKQLAIDGFGQFAQMAGAALMGEDVDWGQAAAQMIGQIASTLGKGLIAMGIPLLFSPITAGEGALMIAGGGALMAVAGAFGTNKGSSRGSGGGSSPAPSANYSSNTGSALSFKPMSTYIEVGGQVRGNNLKISLINTDISNRRVK
jgi:hypothetical protein